MLNWHFLLFLQAAKLSGNKLTAATRKLTPGLFPGFAPGTGPADGPEEGEAPSPSIEAPSPIIEAPSPIMQAPAPVPSGFAGIQVSRRNQSPRMAPGSAPTDPIAYAQSALPPSLSTQRKFFLGEPLAPSPSYPNWLAKAEQVGTNLYYVDSGNQTGFYTVSHPQSQERCK